MTQEDRHEIKQLIKEALIEVFMSPGISQVDAAKFLKVSDRTVRRRISEGKIRTDENGKIPKEELLKYNKSLKNQL